LLLFILPVLKARHWRVLSILSAASLVVVVGFTRVALGAHFLTDVLAAIVFGVIWLTLCLIVGRPMQRRSFRSRPIVELTDGRQAVLAPVEQSAQLVRISRTN
jgi:membrane-associated phospholipid phosphatase